MIARPLFMYHFQFTPPAVTRSAPPSHRSPPASLNHDRSMENTIGTIFSTPSGPLTSKFSTSPCSPPPPPSASPA
eukprot:CAMPEP_0184712082 /NCGR_PEP_ID=MMETSP0314-20130426/2681_1 /TAXON_ID=38298 /ORGANISM="Rhodella maculata, Strain CCMP 736" /LENGTH=74 /DNA_ID=CAMNT_0027174425 /DNA_START=64 /DNA_END=284 /DNA_ORIENTATION=+